jgi:uncharacterized protein DUF5710
MPRIDLRVPMSDKDAANRLGARWDPQHKTWYVPDGVDAGPLQKWIAVPQSPNIRADHWFLATTTRECWCCHISSTVFGIALPEGHEALIVEDDPDHDYWQPGELPTILSYVTDVAEPVASRLQRLAPRYRIDYSQTIHSFYWMNHCEHCGAKLGDFETFEEPGVAFGARGEKIRLLQMLEPISATCGSYSEGLE